MRSTVAYVGTGTCHAHYRLTEQILVPDHAPAPPDVHGEADPVHWSRPG